MITCPSCHSQQTLGALFCGDCGTQLVHLEQGYQEMSENGSGPYSEAHGNPRVALPDDEEAQIYLQFLTEDRVLGLAGRREFTLGRINDNQAIIPDVDLGPYGGYEQGVSRLHAAILINHDRIMVTDLGSINGTAVNGRAIPQHKPHTLTNGDILALGKMKMKVIIRT
jgi:pSer/pThr/pTyr-binding forkhead associated (FHA) protein